ncbi:ZapG family protein [Alteromonas oceanisediminis]|uniref:ZapG family protein n=1 Tax=Alteromonas oceanisediminis TaxID=2836180 RepID=UPI001BD9AD44|nr:DUF1043 family protein [Alteromonas oceanisediminis]MBT0585192.1 DUF1043 family protein [Alteromonas oceanisediminis]
MDILIAIGLVVVGLIIGFFSAQFMHARRDGQNAAQKTAAQNVKAVMTQQAEHHVFQTKQTIEGLEHQLSALRNQIEDYESHLQTKEPQEDEEKLSFFGEQTTAMLRNAYKTKQQKQESSEQQPRDFANSGSGLFVDTKDRSAERTKS